MFGRVLLSLIVLALSCFGLYEETATQVLGKVAGNQFDPSDVSYLMVQGAFHFYHFVNFLGSFVVIGLLVWIWWKPVAAALTTAAFILAIFCLQPQEAKAYYQQTDYAEPYFILPSESAFYVPDVGDNKSSQASFGSEQYLAEKKIAAKRFEIPHTKLANSSMWNNYYVPAGRLIVVDRAPTYREWVAAAHRGTGKDNQSFPCQSSEGLDITVGIAIGAEVYEQDAPKFLYHFGVNPPKGDRTTPEVIFTSVYQGKSLHEVMDGPVRSKIQALVCDEMTAHTLDQNNSQAATTMTNIEKKVRQYMIDVGITLDYIGWADTFDFDPAVQAAINRNYEASQDLKVAQQLAPHVETLKGLASAEAIRTVSNKWNGATPSSISLWWLPESLTNAIAKVGAAFSSGDKK